MIRISKISEVETVYPLIEPLFAAHHRESSTFKNAVVKPNVDLYCAAEKQGRLLCLIAKNDGRVVGYSIAFLASAVHLSDVRFMTSDAFYVMPESRKGRAAYALIQSTLAHAKQMGAQMMIWRSKPDTTWDRTLARLKCTLLEKSWGMELG